ncbi:TRAP transporter substrate-binding protein DctP [Actibacterium sp.]|uniref:TRAP transporter substrate-binding protein DctP n=1 Tax=Actibacterium sp. TaxID=1872125 RepID=UPI003566FDFA
MAGAPVLAKDMRFGGVLPAGSLISDTIEETLAKITDATNGSVKFKYFPGGEVVSSRTSLNGVQDGAVDIAHVTWISFPSELPLSSLIGQAMIFSDGELAASGAVSEYFLVTCEECQGEFEKVNSFPLATEGAARYGLMCNPVIDGVDDLKGRRVRAVGAMGRFASQLGMVPVNIASPEILQSMERGVVDCAFGLLPWLKSYSIGDATHSLLDTGKGAVMGGTTFWMNLSTWKDLSADEKQAFLSVVPDHMYRTSSYAYGSSAEEAIEGIRANGAVITDGGARYAEEMQKFRDSERVTLISLAAERGAADPEKRVNDIIALIEEWNALMAGHEGDQEYFEALVRERVIAKSAILN